MLMLMLMLMVMVMVMVMDQRYLLPLRKKDQSKQRYSRLVDAALARENVPCCQRLIVNREWLMAVNRRLIF